MGEGSREEGEREQEVGGELPMAIFFPQMPATAEAGPSQNQELETPSSYPTSVVGTLVLRLSSTVLPGALAGRAGSEEEKPGASVVAQ